MTRAWPTPQQDGVLKHVLPNGLTVLIEPMHQAPVVALQAWVRVGGADENPHEAGLAHLHEHMLFKGTARRGVGEVARCVEAAGGEINAWTSFDETVYHMVLGRDACELGLDLLADVLQASSFDETELAREIEVVLEEIRRAEDNAGRRLSRALFSSAYTQHPYCRPVLGTAESVAGITQADMLAFYRGHYRPDTTTLIVTGDVAAEAVLAHVTSLFGEWAPAEAGSQQRPLAQRIERPVEPKQQALRWRVLAEPVQEARLTLAWHGTPVRHEDTPALDMFSVLLGHGDSSRLHHALVRPRHVLDAYASNYTPRDPGLLLMGATLEAPRPEGHQVLGALTLLLAEATRLATGPIAAEELEKARTLILAEEAFSRETMEGQARKRGFFVSTAGDYRFEQAHMQGIRAATAADIQRVAQAYLTAAPTVVLQVPIDAPQQTRELSSADVLAAVQTGMAQGQMRPSRQARAPGALGVHRIAIPDGPVLLIQPEPSGVVAMRAVAPGGLRWEAPAHGGLGLLMASSLGQATQTLDAAQLAASVAGLGASLSAFSGRNTVGLCADVLGLNEDAGMALFLQAWLAPEFAEEDVLRERHALAERLRAREDSPGGVASDLFLSTLYPSHPYGFTPLGSAQSLARLHRAEVAAHHAQLLAPARATLAVVGPVDPDAVLERVQAAMAAWTHGAGAPRSRTAALDAPPSGARHVGRPLAKQQAHVIVGAQGLSFTDPDRWALEVLCAVLSGQSGRLFSDLRDAQSLAYSISCSSTEGIEPGHVLVHMACAFDKVGRATDGVRAHVQRLLDSPISGDELTRATEMLVGAHAIDLQRPGARAMAYATQEIYGLGYDAHAHAPAKIRAVTARDVQAVAQRLLTPERLVHVVVGPGDDAGAA